MLHFRPFYRLCRSCLCVGVYQLFRQTTNNLSIYFQSVFLDLFLIKNMHKWKLSCTDAEITSNADFSLKKVSSHFIKNQNKTKTTQTNQKKQPLWPPKFLSYILNQVIDALAVGVMLCLCKLCEAMTCNWLHVRTLQCCRTVTIRVACK